MIVAPNHFSFLDHFFVAVYLRRKVHFMAKSQLFKRPLQFVYHNGGVFPVRRGHRDEEAFNTAHAVLARGDIVVMYCEGGRSRTGELGDRSPASAGWRWSRARRSCRSRSSGSERVRDWKRLQFPKVSVQFGDPIRFEQVEEPTRDQSQAASEQIFEQVRQMHGRLRSGGRRSAVQAARAARRSAEAGGRRPVAD